MNNWDVFSVTDTSYMFYSAFSFNQPIGSWNVANVISMGSMFDDVNLSTSNYDDLLIGWSSLPSLQNGVVFDGSFSKYSNLAVNPRQYIINTYNWTINDGGLEDNSTSTTEPSTSESSTIKPLNGDKYTGLSCFSIFFGLVFFTGFVVLNRHHQK